MTAQYRTVHYCRESHLWLSVFTVVQCSTYPYNLNRFLPCAVPSHPIPSDTSRTLSLVHDGTKPNETKASQQAQAKTSEQCIVHSRHMDLGLRFGAFESLTLHRMTMLSSGSLAPLASLGCVSTH
jgi:hypothetical protein